MIQNKIQFIVDEAGRHLRAAPIGSIRAFTDIAAVIELVTPFPVDSYVEVGYNVYDSRDIKLASFMLPTTDKGADVISEADGLYQQCADWNVFRINVKATALTHIAKYRAGRVGIAFNISDFVRVADMVNYKGEFGASNHLPETAADGDYYICNSYNFNDKGFLWNKGGAAYWKDDEWNKAGRRARMTTSTVDLPVDASVLADAPQISEDEYNQIVIQFAADIASLNERMPKPLCVGYGLNLSQGQDCDVLTLNPPVDVVAGMRTILVALSDWVNGEIVITPEMHGMGNNPNLMVSTHPIGEGETYDSPIVDDTGKIIIKADVEWEGKVLIAGGVAEKGDKGDIGEKGDKPAHEWQGTELRFENPNGTWGNFVNLKGNTGDKGDKGDTGEGFAIKKVFNSVQSMIDSGGAGLVEGDFVLIETGDVNDIDNAKLYVYEGNGEFGFLTDLSGAQGIKGEKGDKPAHQWQGTELRFENIDGSWGNYTDLKGEKGNPSTLDKLGINATTIDLSDNQIGAYGTIDSPIEISEESTITFINYTPQTGLKKSFELCVRRNEDVAVHWGDITAWAYDEIPLLPVGKVQEIKITTVDGINFYGTGGDVF